MTTHEVDATHSRYSDPGEHATSIAAIEPEPAAVHASAWNVITHYRAGGVALSEEQLRDVDTRWLGSLLDTLQRRTAGPLDLPRAPEHRLGGCCRDFTLFAVSVFRQHGVPARSRVGFGGYFGNGFHHDHVVAEYWDGGRWVRFDAQFPSGAYTFDIHDMPTGPGAPFQTAAEVWRAIRAGETDPALYGVDPSMPMLGGAGFVRSYVATELAHRMHDEVLLWDLWGAALAALDGTPADDADARADVVADLLVRADGGDTGAEDELAARYGAEPDLAPGRTVVTMSPLGRRGDTDLVSRTTRWATDSSAADTAGYTVPIHATYSGG